MSTGGVVVGTDYLDVTLDAGVGYGVVLLTPKQARRLAQHLLDAAADVEAEPAEAGK